MPAQPTHIAQLPRPSVPGGRKVSTEAYVQGKRGLLTRKKRPTYKEKEAYLQGKRDLLAWRKRLVLRVGLQRCINAGVPEVRSVSKETYYKAKETYSYGKRGLFTLAYRIPEVRSVSKETYFAAKEA